MADHPSFLSELPPFVVAIWNDIEPAYLVVDGGHDDGKSRDVRGDSADIMMPNGEVCSLTLPQDTELRPLLLEKCRGLQASRGRRAFFGIPRFADPLQVSDLLVQSIPSTASTVVSQIFLPSGNPDRGGFRVRTSAERVRLVLRESAETLLVREVPCFASEKSECEFEVYAGRRAADDALSVNVVTAPSLASAYFRYVQVGLLQGAGAVGRRLLQNLATEKLSPDTLSALAAAVYCSTLGNLDDIEHYLKIAPRLVKLIPSAQAARELRLLGVIIRYKAEGAEADKVGLKDLLGVSPLNLPLVSSTLFDVRDIVARSTVHDGDRPELRNWISGYFDWSAEVGTSGPEILFRSQSWEQPSIRVSGKFDAWSEAKKKSTPAGR